MLTLEAFFTHNGWTRYEAGWINPAGDRYVDVSGDYGYAWELKHFSDGDIDGVATARWVTEAEGDTVAELEAALR
jgi:hypothetical protein